MRARKDDTKKDDHQPARFTIDEAEWNNYMVMCNPDDPFEEDMLVVQERMQEMTNVEGQEYDDVETYYDVYDQEVAEEDTPSADTPTTDSGPTATAPQKKGHDDAERHYDEEAVDADTPADSLTTDSWSTTSPMLYGEILKGSGEHIITQDSELYMFPAKGVVLEKIESSDAVDTVVQKLVDVLEDLEQDLEDLDHNLQIGFLEKAMDVVKKLHDAKLHRE